MTSARPLAGLRVVDFGQYIAGPAAAMMLADLGADVIRVERPGGPVWKCPATAVLNRGKRSLVLDLKADGERESARRLIERADAVVENFRPGVMDRLGLGPAAMTARNDGLVYLSLPGFSGRDPERAGLPAWEGIIAAAVGQFTDMGLNRVLMGINPSFSPLPLASAYGAVLGAAAVTLALFARETHGRGDVIEVPLAAALMEGLAYNSMVVENLPERYKSLREREIERRRAAGQPMDMSYEDLQELLDPFYRSYTCADGRPFYAVCSSHRAHPVEALKLLGLWDELREAGLTLADPYLDMAAWPEGTDCTLYAYPLSRPWADRVAARMKEAFRQRTSFEWEGLFGAAGVPGAAHRTSREWLASDHARASGLVLEVDDPRFGTMRQPGNVAWLAGDGDAAMEKRPAPTPDQDRAEILAELEREPASTPTSVHSADGRTGWLDGLRVLDFTNVIAGPTIASTLARFGAGVISVDPPRPALDPWNTIVFGLQANQGKRSVLLDLKSDDGQAALERLIRWADVVTVNALDRQLSGLGLDPVRLRALNPKAILCQLDAYGGPRPGPRSDHPGYDDLVQASTGIMARFGGSLETPEEHAHFGTIDVLTGFCATLAIGAALLKQARGGGPDTARASLAAAGQLIQAPFLYDFADRGPFNEPSGRRVKGAHALYRCYQAADAWFFLAAKPEHQASLASVPELKEAVDLAGDELEAFFVERFSTRRLAHWIDALRPLGIAVQQTESLAALRDRTMARADDPDLELTGPTVTFVRHRDHPCGRTVDLAAPNAIRPRATIRLPAPAPKYGAQTRAVLREIGYDDRDIEALIAAGIAAEAWGDAYLPD